MYIKKDHTTIKLSIFFIGFLSLFFGSTQVSFAQYWNYEGGAWYAYPSKTAETVPVYRFWSDNFKSHFFTTSESEKNKLIAGDTNWWYEGVAWNAYSNKAADTVPVYRFWSANFRSHFFTITESEKDNLIANDTNWWYEGIAYYVHKNQAADTKLVYRFWNDSYRSHFFTISESEKNFLESQLYGPKIKVGLYEYTKSALEENSFRITSEKPYVIKKKDGTKIADVPANEQTRVKYIDDDNHTYRIYNSIPEINAEEEIYFEAKNTNDMDMVFDIERPELNFSQYRGKIKLRYSNNDGTKRIWVINELPLEHYIWGMGEITGTGPSEYNKLMTTAYRTYGYWKILYSTKYATEGFKVNATPGNQLYYGYEWEKRYPRIRQGAEATRGKIAKHGSDVALTPYSSWTDGRTRSFEERWGSTLYPWCQSVSDSYGDYNGDYWDNSSYKSTSELVGSGNHMVGISAHGALTLANDKGWDWQKIMKYYLDNINIVSIY